MSLIIGIALVTHKGICFRDHYYSCPIAIKERWYELAWRNGSWNIDIEYDTCNHLVIYISANKEDKEVCNIINIESVSGEKLERYFQSIKRLKRKAKMIRNRG